MRLRRADSSRLPRHTHARATRRSGCSRSSIRSITREPGQMCTVTKLSIMLFQRISMLSRLTSGVAAGPGIRVLPGGCSEPASKVFWDCEFEARHCILIRAFRRRGQDSASCYRSARCEIQVENPRGVSGRIQLATLDGETLSGNKTGIPLTDDGATHQIRIVLR
jgi:hypothetical protein